MPFQRVDSTFAAVGGAPVNAVETVVGTSPAVNTSGVGARVRIHASGSLLTGATTTALVIKVERGTAAGGTQVGASVTILAGAAQNIPWTIDVTDIIGEVAGQQWVVTITQTGGSSTATGGPTFVQTISD